MIPTPLFISIIPSGNGYKSNNGFIELKNSNKHIIKLKFCSFDILDNDSKISEIALWNHSYLQPTLQSLHEKHVDILVLKKKENVSLLDVHKISHLTFINNPNDHERIYFSIEKNEKPSHLINLLKDTYSVPKKTLEEIIPKLYEYINVISLRKFKRIQFEAGYVMNCSMIIPQFKPLLDAIHFGDIKFKNVPIDCLKEIASFTIGDLKNRLSSPRWNSKEFQLTQPHLFIRDHGDTLIALMKKAVTERLFWGCNPGDEEYFKNRSIGTVRWLFRKYLPLDLIEVIRLNAM